MPPPGKAATEQVPILREVGIDQKLGDRVPLDLVFVDESGRDVRLGDLFRDRPVVLALVYYECPMLCTQVLSGLDGSLTALSFSAGKEFDLVVVSFDPGETPALAADRRKNFINRYRRVGSEGGIRFLTGRQESIAKLADAVGFRYAYDEAIDQYAHPAAITLLTGDGRVSRYLYGIEFAPQGPAPRARGGVRGTRRHGCRYAAALLLPLRPREREVRHGDHEPHPAGRCAHRRGPGRVYRRLAAA